MDPRSGAGSRRLRVEVSSRGLFHWQGTKLQAGSKCSVSQVSPVQPLQWNDLHDLWHRHLVKVPNQYLGALPALMKNYYYTHGEWDGLQQSIVILATLGLA